MPRRRTWSRDTQPLHEVSSSQLATCRRETEVKRAGAVKSVQQPAGAGRPTQRGRRRLLSIDQPYPVNHETLLSYSTIPPAPIRLDVHQNVRAIEIIVAEVWVQTAKVGQDVERAIHGKLTEPLRGLGQGASARHKLIDRLEALIGNTGHQLNITTILPMLCGMINQPKVQRCHKLDRDPQ
jgi:hypothetical protein